MKNQELALEVSPNTDSATLAKIKVAIAESLLTPRRPVPHQQSSSIDPF